MKTYKNKNNSKKKLLIIAFAVVLIVMSIFAYLASTGRLFDTQHTTPLKSVDANKDGSNGANSVPGAATTTEPNKTIIPNDTNATQQTNIEKPTITRANQSGTTVRISAIFSKPAFGDCVLTIEKADQTTITRTVQVVVGPSYYVCDGFVLNTNIFPSSGNWTVTVTHKHNNESVFSDQTTLVIQ